MKNILKLNAWLERSDPLVELRNHRTGEVVLSVRGNMLHEILASSNISHDDLYTEKNILVYFIEELFSTYVSDALGVNSEPSERRKKYDAEIVDFPYLKKSYFSCEETTLKKTANK